MEQVTWEFVVPLYPVNFADPILSVSKFINSQLDCFIPELEGVLKSVDMSALQVFPAACFENTVTGACCLFKLSPELDYILIRCSAPIELFRPKIGSVLPVVVSSIKKASLFCQHAATNTTVILQLPVHMYRKSVGDQLEIIEEGVTLKVGDAIEVIVERLGNLATSTILYAKLIGMLGNSSNSREHLGTDGLPEVKHRPKKRKLCADEEIKPNLDLVLRPDPEDPGLQLHSFVLPDQDPVELCIKPEPSDEDMVGAGEYVETVIQPVTHKSKKKRQKFVSFAPGTALQDGPIKRYEIEKIESECSRQNELLTMPDAVDQFSSPTLNKKRRHSIHGSGRCPLTTEQLRRLTLP
ncbi:unnamed protein product [Protopolystoma xenopodis]|uniref:RPA43 OB domain-containing protein n=1 Tax=Protopolystoma xenopodis TaxID=117903 RepID=A0A3S4ZCX0_9PLAT|nr:unnamed protein product [Protopolystoma xenopodis]